MIKGIMTEEKKVEKKIEKKKFPKYQETKHGLTIVYTGEGKGKTTAALGLAIRAAGYKRKVLIIQFGKTWFTGELEGVKKLAPYVKMIQGGLGFVKIFDDNYDIKEHQEMANRTYEMLKKEVGSGKWDVVIADEIVGAIAGKLLTQQKVIDLIKAKPKKLDLVLTGHHGKPALFKHADLVTEMIQVKHPYQKGFLAKEGVDY